jgi:hypothetical protein
VEIYISSPSSRSAHHRVTVTTQAIPSPPLFQYTNTNTNATSLPFNYRKAPRRASYPPPCIRFSHVEKSISLARLYRLLLCRSRAAARKSLSATETRFSHVGVEISRLVPGPVDRRKDGRLPTTSTRSKVGLGSGSGVGTGGGPLVLLFLLGCDIGRYCTDSDKRVSHPWESQCQRIPPQGEVRRKFGRERPSMRTPWNGMSSNCKLFDLD